MRMKTIISSSGNKFKGNIHMHTTISDGSVCREEAIRQYRSNGYDFIAITDHRKPGPTEFIKGDPDAVSEYEKRDFLIMSGAEWDTGSNYPGDGRIFHILGIGTGDIPSLRKYPWGTSPGPEEMIKAIADAGGISILCHPSWSVMDPDDISRAEGVSGAEIYNTVSGLPWNVARADSSQYFDIWASRGLMVTAVAADDAHHYDGDQCVSYILVDADELSEKAVTEAIRDGKFYASQGPVITEYVVDRDRSEIRMKVSKDVVKAVFYSNYSWSDERTIIPDEDGIVIRHTVDTETFMRCELLTADGKRAWTSPVALR